MGICPLLLKLRRRNKDGEKNLNRTETFKTAYCLQKVCTRVELGSNIRRTLWPRILKRNINEQLLVSIRDSNYFKTKNKSIRETKKKCTNHWGGNSILNVRSIQQKAVTFIWKSMLLKYKNFCTNSQWKKESNATTPDFLGMYKTTRFAYVICSDNKQSLKSKQDSRDYA